MFDDRDFHKRNFHEYRVLANRKNACFIREDFSYDTIQLDLGCGQEQRKPTGYIGIDINPDFQPDIVWDLSNGIPFADRSVERVRAHDFIEHLEDGIFIMKEIWRVLVPCGRADIVVPSTDGAGAFQDLRHKSFWNANTFGYWTNRSGWMDDTRGPCLFKKEELYVTWADDVAHVHATLMADKTFNWLSVYFSRHPEDFVRVRD